MGYQWGFTFGDFSSLQHPESSSFHVVDDVTATPEVGVQLCQSPEGGLRLSLVHGRRLVEPVTQVVHHQKETGGHGVRLVQRGVGGGAMPYFGEQAGNFRSSAPVGLNLKSPNF